MSASFTLDDQNWKTFVNRSTTVNAFSRQLVRAWIIIYLADMTRRFQKNSRGGGDWPKIKASTAEQKGNSLILIEMGKLKKALQMGAPGSLVKFLSNTIGAEVGFSNASHSKGISYNKLARIHQNGEGKNPKREILVPPSPQAVQQMVKATQVAISNMQAGLR